MTVTPERWGVIDEESIQEARELLGVPLRRDRMQWNDYATQDAIRQFADEPMVQSPCPAQLPVFR